MKLAVIPARGGSKRIPKKNIKEFCGKPIIAWSIEKAIRCEFFDKIIVSTDDDEIAEIATKYGADIPFIRPKELSDDYTGTASVIAHAINFFEKLNSLYTETCCIYPAAPFIHLDDIVSGYETLMKTGANYTVSCSKFTTPIQRAFRIKNNTTLEMFSPEFFSYRTQDLEDAWHDAGQFYWGLSDAWKKNKPIFSDNSTPIKLKKYHSIDIDTEEDWDFAEKLFFIQNGFKTYDKVDNTKIN